MNLQSTCIVAALALCACASTRRVDRVPERLRWMEVGRQQWSGERPLEGATGVWTLRFDGKSETTKWVVVQDGPKLFVEPCVGTPLGRRGLDVSEANAELLARGAWRTDQGLVTFDPSFDAMTVEWIEQPPSAPAPAYQPNLGIGKNLGVQLLHNLGKPDPIRHVGTGERAWKRPAQPQPTTEPQASTEPPPQP